MYFSLLDSFKDLVLLYTTEICSLYVSWFRVSLNQLIMSGRHDEWHNFSYCRYVYTMYIHLQNTYIKCNTNSIAKSFTEVYSSVCSETEFTVLCRYLTGFRTLPLLLHTSNSTNHCTYNSVYLPTWALLTSYVLTVSYHALTNLLTVVRMHTTGHVPVRFWSCHVVMLLRLSYHVLLLGSDAGFPLFSQQN